MDRKLSLKYSAKKKARELADAEPSQEDHLDVD